MKSFPFFIYSSCHDIKRGRCKGTIKEIEAHLIVVQDLEYTENTFV